MFISDNPHVYNKFFKTTYLATFFYIGIYTYLFLLTPYLTSIGWNDMYKGLFFTVFSAVGILVAPIVGTLSDKIGRFKMIVTGLIIEIIALAGYTHITEPLPLLAVRFISAIAFNAIVISSISRIHDVSDNAHRSENMGIYSSLLAIATILAPLLGGFIADNYGYAAMFQVAQVIMISILISIIIYDKILYKKQNYVSSGRRHEKFLWKDLNPFSHIRVLFAHPRLRKAGLLGMFINATVPVYTLLIPYLVVEVYGFSNTELTLIMLFRGLTHMFQFEIGKIPVRIGKPAGIILGIGIDSIGYFILFFAHTFSQFASGLLFLGVGGALWNLSMNSYLSDIAEEKNIEGEVLGAFQGLSRFTITISFFITGLMLSLWQEHILLLYVFFCMLGILFFAIPLLKLEKNKPDTMRTR